MLRSRLVSTYQTEAELRDVDAASKVGVGYIVKLSTLGAESEFFIVLVHRPVEQTIEQSGIAHTFPRPNRNPVQSKP